MRSETLVLSSAEVLSRISRDCGRSENERLAALRAEDIRELARILAAAAARPLSSRDTTHERIERAVRVLEQWMRSPAVPRPSADAVLMEVRAILA